MSKHRFDTLQLHAGQTPDSQTKARAVPVYQTTAYMFDSSAQAADLFALKAPGFMYSRFQNPTVEVFEKRMAALEGGVGALAVASGSAAVTMAVLNMMGAGSHILATSKLYGGTHNLFANTLPHYGITCTFADPDDPEAFCRGITPATRAVFLETIGNPGANLCDVDAIAKLAHAAGIPVIIDNTFGTPYLYRPAEHGADIIVHSATKYIGGHGTTLAGVIVDAGSFDWKASGLFPMIVNPDPGYHDMSYADSFGASAFIVKAQVQLQRDIGASLPALSAFLLLQGLETLSLRLDRHVRNARAVAAFLEKHPGAAWVSYPELASSPYKRLADRDFPLGVGGIFSFGIKGGIEAGRRFIDALQLFSHVANVADAKSLVIHPASTTHAQLSEADMRAGGIAPEMIRLSIGLEDINDLLEDLERGLKAAR